MGHHRITIESTRPDRPTERHFELALRVTTETYDETEKIARQMLTAWCDAHPGTPATYIITGLSAHDMGQDW